MLIVHNAQRTGVVPLLTDLQQRFGTDYAGVGTLFAAYVFGYAIFLTHIVLAMDILILMPLTKFAHVVYRTLALALHEWALAPAPQPAAAAASNA